MRNAERPYVICHMLPSIDGRIVIRGWKLKNATREYETTAATFDELSILVAPIADGSTGTPSLFDVENRRAPARNLKLLSMEKRAGDVVWLRYEVRR